MNNRLKKWIASSLLVVKCFAFSSPQLIAQEETDPEVASGEVFIDYQNFNHGYCAECDCNPCQCSCGPCGDPVIPAPCAAPCAAPCEAPCAPVCGTACGISICALGVGIAALITAAVIIVSSGNGSSSHS